MTKEKFKAYLTVQFSGLTNMFDVKQVIMFSDDVLNKADCLDIMKNYDKYLTNWPELEKEVEDERWIPNQFAVYSTMKVKIEINCDNAAFDDDADYEVSRILEELSDDILQDTLLTDRKLYDINGNKVGFLKIVK